MANNWLLGDVFEECLFCDERWGQHYSARETPVENEVTSV